MSTSRTEIQMYILKRGWQMPSKKWIVLAQSTNDLAFDVRHVRTFIYSDKMGADATFKKSLQQALTETIGARHVGELEVPLEKHGAQSGKGDQR